MLRQALGFNRRNGVALGLVAALLAIGYVVAPGTAYGAWLAIFSVWMAWFVLVAVEWIEQADF